MCRCLTYCGATAAVVAMAAVIVGNLWPMSPTNYWDKKKVTTVPEWMPVLGHVTELVYPRWHFFDEVSSSFSNVKENIL